MDNDIIESNADGLWKSTPNGDEFNADKADDEILKKKYQAKFQNGQRQKCDEWQRKVNFGQCK